MSHSPELRIENIQKALLLMIEEVGDEVFNRKFISPRDSQYSEIFPTTWQELETRFLVKNVVRGQWVVLTESGWLKGIELTGKLLDQAFKDKMSKLAGALKNNVKGREQPALVSVTEIANQAQLDISFVINAIQTKLLDKAFVIKGATIENQMIVKIPIDFGHRPISI